MNAKITLSQLGLLLAALLIFTGTQAFGQSIITQDINFSVFDLPTNTGQANDSGSQPYNLFNTNLGTLTEVEISLENVSVTGTVNVLNQSGTTQTYTNITLNGDYTVMDNFTHSVTLTLQTPGVSLGPINNGANESTNPLTAGPAPTQTTIITGAGIVGFEGTGSGTTTLTLTSNNSENVTGHGTFTGSQSSNGVGDVVLTYIYTPVPEPTKTAAWLMGFAVCVLAARKYFPRRTLSLA